MANVHGVMVRQPPKAPNVHPTKRAALAANVEATVIEKVFLKDQKDTVDLAAKRINKNQSKHWPASRYYAIPDVDETAVVRRKPDTRRDSTIELIGFVDDDGRVINEFGKDVGALADIEQRGGVEVGALLLLVGNRSHAPEGWLRYITPKQRKSPKAKEAPEEASEGPTEEESPEGAESEENDHQEG